MSQLTIQNNTTNHQTIDNETTNQTTKTDASKNSFLDDFEILEDIPTGNTSLGTKPFEGAEIDQNTNISKQKLLEIEKLTIPPTKSSLRNALGRFFLSIINFFKGVKSSDTLNVEEKLAVLRNKKPADLKKLPETTKPISLNIKQLGKITGIGGNTVIQPFVEYNPNDSSLQSKLYPHGEPRLSDIKQDPDLQDCWFLSCISSGISSMGTKAISRLFSESKTPGNVLVRLDNNLYDVPLGRITNGKDSFGSKSANWVVALENAMAMHLFATSQGQQSTVNPMQKRSTLDGLQALFGVACVLNTDQNQLIGEIKKLLQNNCAVVLGHGGSLSDAIGDGIAPKHAVSILNVNDDDSLTVLDPYGEVKELKAGSLAHCSITHTEILNNNEQKEILTTPPKNVIKGFPKISHEEMLAAKNNLKSNPNIIKPTDN